uniref:Uncharacterized protein n=1 Tax=Leersia perrieri TaxID=77586 RepID=A0A0D9XKY6_9ORYZ
MGIGFDWRVDVAGVLGWAADAAEEAAAEVERRVVLDPVALQRAAAAAGEKDPGEDEPLLLRRRPLHELDDHLQLLHRVCRLHQQRLRIPLQPSHEDLHHHRRRSRSPPAAGDRRKS